MAEELSLPVFRFSKLNGSNYREWKINIRLLLMERGLWDIVTGVEHAPPVSQIEESARFRLRRSKAYSTIALSLEPAQQLFMDDNDDPKVFWEKLASIFEPTSRARIGALRTEFQDARLHTNEHLPEFIARLEDTKRRYVAAGGSLTDSDLAFQMIGHLPSVFDNVVSACYQLSEKEFTSQRVKIALLAEYERIKIKEKVDSEKDENVTGASGSAFGLKSTPKVSQQQKLEESSSRTSIAPAGQAKQKKFNGVCFRCQKFGHSMRFCRSSGEKFDNSKGRGRASAKRGREQVKMPGDASGGFFMSACLTVTKEDEWIIDSAATHHFSFRRDWFCNFQEVSMRTVDVALGESQVEGRGDIHLLVYTSDGPRQVTLYNVFYTPHLCRNLISSRLIDVAGYKVVIAQSCARVYTKSGMLFLEAPLQSNNMYVVQGKVLPTDECYEIPSSANAISLELWHQRLGHVNVQCLKEMFAQGSLLGLGKYSGDLHDCVTCNLTKMTQKGGVTKDCVMTTHPLQLVHADVWGPSPVKSLGGALYFVSFIDDYSRKVTVFTLRNKTNVLDMFRTFQTFSERQVGHKVGTIRTDNGKEFANAAFEEYLKKEGIHFERTSAYSPQMNGIAERENRTLMDTTRALLKESGLPQTFWAEALHTAVYIRNRVKHSKLKGKVPEELWKGSTPSARHLRRFGSVAFTHIPKVKRTKLEDRSEVGILVGYAMHSIGYRVWIPNRNKIIQSKHVKVNEAQRGVDVCQLPVVTQVYRYNSSWPKTAGEEQSSTLNGEAEVHLRADSSCETGKSSQQSELPKGWTRLEVPRKSGVYYGWADVYYVNAAGQKFRSRPELENFMKYSGEPLNMDLFSFSRVKVVDKDDPVDDPVEALCTEIVIPTTVIEARASNQSEQWERAMEEELQLLKKRQVYEEVQNSSGKRVVGSRWVFAIKRNASGEIQRYKARLVAKGFSQREGVDFSETYSPVIHFAVFRMLFYMLVVCLGWLHKHVDITCAYLYGQLQEEIYMSPAPGFDTLFEKGTVWKLNRALYGLKQAGKAWFLELDVALKKFGFVNLASCQCAYIWKCSVVLLVYVDDLVFFAVNSELLLYVMTWLSSVFDVKDLGPVMYFLGVELSQCFDSYYIHQTRYLDDLLKKYNYFMRPSKIPMHPDCRSLRELSDVDFEHSFPFRELLGSLMYLALRTRPDIMLSISLLARFSSCPGLRHWQALLQVLSYVKTTKELCLKYTKGDVSPMVFSDASWGSDIDTRRSMSGYILFLGKAPIAWRSKLQSCVALSSMESEYIALSEAAKEMIWASRIMKEISEKVQIEIPKPVLLTDNQSAIYFAKNPVENNRSKHVALRYHFIRENVENDEFQLKFVCSRNNIADMFTKPLSVDRFNLLRENVVTKQC